MVCYSQITDVGRNSELKEEGEKKMRRLLLLSAPDAREGLAYASQRRRRDPSEDG